MHDVGKNKGFTLIELIVIIVIVGIVALIAAPRFFTQSTFDASRFHEAAISAIRYAQKVAVAQRANVFVITNASTLVLCYDAACATPVPNPGSNDNYVLNLPAGIAITATSFNFNSLGQPVPNVQTTLNLSGDPNPRQIVVEQETGYVHR